MAALGDIAVTTDLATSNDALPAGLIIPYAGATPPIGWVWCDGHTEPRTVSGSSTPLFSLIGTDFGAGDASTTYNVPDLRGRTLVGPDALGGTAADRVPGASVANSGGATTHTLSYAEMTAHNHGGTTHYMNRNAVHSHNIRYNGQAYAHNTAESIATPTTSGGYASTYTDTNHQHGVNGSGGGAAHDNVQPYQAANFIIKT